MTVGEGKRLFKVAAAIFIIGIFAGVWRVGK